MSDEKIMEFGRHNNSMLQDITAKQAEMGASIISIDKTLIKQQVILEEHMKRSAANEKAVELLSQEIKPIQAHVSGVNAVLKFLGLVGSLLFALSKIFPRI